MPERQEVEILQLFAQEAEERLHDLGEKLLTLEADGPEPELISSVFREAHNLKGAAAVVGLNAVSEVAHAMEDILEGLRRGSRLATPELVDSLLKAVDGLRTMVPRAVEGADLTDDARRLVDSLGRARSRSDSTAAGTEVAPGQPEGTVIASPPEAAPARETGSRSSRGDILRLPAERMEGIVRLVGEAAAAQLRLGRVLGEGFGMDPAGVSEYRDLSLALTELQQRSMRAQMVPVSTITDPLRRAVRDLARQLGKQVRWEVRGGDTELDRTILDQLANPLMHLVRNALDHGIEQPEERVAAGKPAEGSIRLHAMQLGSEVVVALTDDGRGIDVEGVKARADTRGADASGLADEEALELIFKSGVSTVTSVSDVSGRGIGLDAVRAGVEAVRGRIEVRSERGVGAEFRISVPITLTLLPCLMVTAGHQRFAIPTHAVVTVLPEGSATTTAESTRFVLIGGQAVALSNLAATLGLPAPEGEGPVVVLAGLTRRHAFAVDGLIGQRDVVLRGLSRLVPRLNAFAGASVEPDGSILLVLDPTGLVDRGRARRRFAPDGEAVAQGAEPGDEEATDDQPRMADILVVDDALTVRELQRSILERAGYQVRTATDGLQALAALAEKPADLILTDIEMPNMDGFQLTERIRATPSLTNLPVIILTTQGSDEYRRRGLDAGADGYIVKSAFDSAALLEAVERLLGPRAA